MFYFDVPLDSNGVPLATEFEVTLTFDKYAYTNYVIERPGKYVLPGYVTVSNNAMITVMPLTGNVYDTQDANADDEYIGFTQKAAPKASLNVTKYITSGTQVVNRLYDSTLQAKYPMPPHRRSASRCPPQVRRLLSPPAAATMLCSAIRTALIQPNSG